MTYADTVSHALSEQCRSLEQQRDAARRWAESALTEAGVLRLAIEDALAVSTDTNVDRILRAAVRLVPTQRTTP